MESNEVLKGQREDVSQVSPENVPLREWARIVNVKDSYAYEQSRHNRIPGMFRVGKFVRVHMPTFYSRTRIEQ